MFSPLDQGDTVHVVGMCMKMKCGHACDNAPPGPVAARKTVRVFLAYETRATWVFTLRGVSDGYDSYCAQ